MLMYKMESFSSNFYMSVYKALILSSLLMMYGCGQLGELAKDYQLRLMNCQCTSPYKISLRSYNRSLWCDYSV
jgi:hypothetical protein